MPNATAASYAHTVARLAGCSAAALTGLDVMDLDVLYFGIMSDGAPASFRDMADRLETAVLETYQFNGVIAETERAYCRLLLARRANAARYAA